MFTCTTTDAINEKEEDDEKRLISFASEVINDNERRYIPFFLSKLRRIRWLLLSVYFTLMDYLIFPCLLSFSV